MNGADDHLYKVGFAVLYQWRVKPGKLRQFCDAWAALIEALRRQRGALGGRLHRTDQGTWIAYAQWPSRQSWEDTCNAEPVDPAASHSLQDAVEDTWPPVLMSTHDDRML
jgi:quinol monooxygenase YgiN